MSSSESADAALRAEREARRAAEAKADELSQQNKVLAGIIDQLQGELEEKSVEQSVENSGSNDLVLRNEALEGLVNSLMVELEELETRRRRERRHQTELSGAKVPLASVRAMQATLVEGATQLMAMHEHTLRTVELRLASMSEQLERCEVALPVSRRIRDDELAYPEPPSSAQKELSFNDEEWAAPTIGGISLDSLPLHMPSESRGAGVTSGGAYGIHGRRPALSTLAWSNGPHALRLPWWEELAGDDFAGEEENELLSLDKRAAAAVAAAVGGGAAAAAVPRPPSAAEQAERLASYTSLIARAIRMVDESGGTSLAGWEGDFALEVSTELFDKGGALPSDVVRQSSLGQAMADAFHMKPTATPLSPPTAKSRKAAVANAAEVPGWLHASIAKHPLIATLSPGLRREVVRACMREVKVRPGTVVAAQGAVCDSFAVISSGTFDGYIAEAGPTPVRAYERGDAFGDLGLVCSCTHTVTVRCREAGSLWVLRRDPFQYALLATCQIRADSACRVLRRVGALEALSDTQLGLLATALQEVDLPPGASLLRKGEAWDALYIVVTGTLEDRHQIHRPKVRVQGFGSSDGAKAQPLAAPRRLIRAGEALGEEALRDAMLEMRSPTDKDDWTSSAKRRRSFDLCAGGGGGGGGAELDSGSGESSYSSNGAAARGEVSGVAGAMPLRTPSIDLPGGGLRSSGPLTDGSGASVTAGEHGCSLLRLPVAALVEALSATSPSTIDVQSRGSFILRKLAEHEPALGAAFTSVAQRAQLLTVLEVIRPPPGATLQIKGEISEGLLYLDAGEIDRGFSRRGAMGDDLRKVIRTGNGVSFLVSAGATHDGEPSEAAATGPVATGAVLGSLGSEPAPVSLYAHVGVTAYRLPRRAALVILSSTHELRKGVLTPRIVPYHLRRPMPGPPPFSSLEVAALLGEGGASKVLLVRKCLPTSDASSTGAETPNAQHGAEARKLQRQEYALKVFCRPSDPPRRLKPGAKGSTSPSRPPSLRRTNTISVSGVALSIHGSFGGGEGGSGHQRTGSSGSTVSGGPESTRDSPSSHSERGDEQRHSHSAEDRHEQPTLDSSLAQQALRERRALGMCTHQVRDDHGWPLMATDGH